MNEDKALWKLNYHLTLIIIP